MENASRRYDYPRVREMIERQKEKYGWEFLFLGANIDAAKEAARFGISAEHAANYHADHQGTGLVYEAVNAAVCAVRASRPLENEWRASIDKDFESRK
jgi:heme oxygenase